MTAKEGILTDEQFAVVHHAGGHAYVLAAPGSGKTHTLVRRIAYLVENGVVPRRILAVMFNRTPAADFAARLAPHMTRLHAPAPHTRTFHQLGHRLVKTLMTQSLLPEAQLDASERTLVPLAMRALSDTLRECPNTGSLDAEHKSDFLRFIELVKAGVRMPEEVFTASDLPAERIHFVAAFHRFEELRAEARTRFYADLIWDPLNCLRTHPEARERLANRIEHLLVDEYQDVNLAQHELLRLLAGDRAIVMVVGDDDQCIYDWRGASPTLLTGRFPQDYSGVTRYSLSRTFRYGHELALAANHVISRNRARHPKLGIASASNPDTCVTLHEWVHPVSQRELATHPIVDILGHWRDTRSLREAAVLVRLWNMAVPIELALLQAGIPYHLDGRTPVFELREVNGLLGILRLACGHLTELPRPRLLPTLEDMLSTPHLGITNELRAQLARDIATGPNLAHFHIAGLASKGLRFRQIEVVRRRADLWEEFIQGAHSQLPPGQVLSRYARDTDLLARLRAMATTEEEAEDRVLACEAMIDQAQAFRGTTAEFIETMDSLWSRQNDLVDKPEAVTITTVHRAKGLEWPLVILPSLTDRDFPYRRRRAEVDIESERRLFYVAMTRARERLALIAPSDSGLATALPRGVLPPAPQLLASRFVYETNMHLSRHVAAALHGRAGARREVHGSRLEIIEKYLRAAAVEFRRDRPAQDAEQFTHGARAHSTHPIGAPVVRSSVMVVDGQPTQGAGEPGTGFAAS